MKVAYEGDLHKSLVDCDKNPGHKNFTPVSEFNRSHLPPGYQDPDIEAYIKAQADLTGGSDSVWLVFFLSKILTKYTDNTQIISPCFIIIDFFSLSLTKLKSTYKIYRP